MDRHSLQRRVGLPSCAARRLTWWREATRTCRGPFEANPTDPPMKTTKSSARPSKSIHVRLCFGATELGMENIHSQLSALSTEAERRLHLKRLLFNTMAPGRPSPSASTPGAPVLAPTPSAPPPAAAPAPAVVPPPHVQAAAAAEAAPAASQPKARQSSESAPGPKQRPGAMPSPRWNCSQQRLRRQRLAFPRPYV